MWQAQENKSGKCHSATYIPLFIICKGSRRSNPFGEGLLPGAAFEKTENSNINMEVFLKWPQHTQVNRDAGNCLFILHGNSSR